ncbi:MAG: futalosine hydrolase [Thermodesulfobacteriota bacterium]
MAWLVVVAVTAEADMIAPRLAPAPAIAGRPAWRGRIAGRAVLLLVGGLGLVNAAQAVTAALEREPDVDAVVNLGCAGAYAKSGLALGQAALASECVLADWGVAAARGWRPLNAIGLPLGHAPDGQARYHRWPCDPGLAQLFLAANPNLTSGAFNSVVQVSGDATAAARLENRWGAIIEEMEGAAVAQVAAHYGRPCAALRGVSNIAGQRELDIEAGARAAQQAFLRLEEMA